MTESDDHWGVLLDKGNLYKTRIRLDGGRVVLRQARLAPGLGLTVIALIGFAMSPWLGGPLLACAALILVWSKGVSVDTATGDVCAHTGIPPFLRRMRGTREDVDRVEWRKVVISHTTGSGQQSFGKWRIWDVTIHGFDGRLDFSAWEEGDEEKTRHVAEALGKVFRCEVVTVPAGPRPRE